MFLEDVTLPGTDTPLIPKIRNNFNCLQQTGEFCPNSGSGNNQ